MTEPEEVARLDALRAEVSALRSAARAAAAAPAPGTKVVSTSAEASEGPSETATLDLKAKGNQRFKLGDFSGALAIYSRALLLDSDNYLLFSNRAACHLRLGQHEAAAGDAKRALDLCPEEAQPYVKGYHRLSQGLVGLGRFGDAQRAVEHGLRIVAQGGQAEKADALIKMLAEVESKRDETEAAALAKEGLRNAVDPRRRPKVREFEPLEELGHGNFSTIVRAAHRTTGEPFAMKIIHKRDIEKTKRRHPNVENEIQMEKKVLLRCRGHSNVLYLYHTLSDYNSLFFLTELCDGGETWARLTLAGRAAGVPRSLATFWVAEVVRGLGYLHQQGVVHRDLKPENILLDRRGRVRLADFGTAKDLQDTSLNGPEFCGTPEYMSPEAVSSRPTGYATDLWALGCVVYQFLAGYPPFRAHSPYLSFLRIKRGQVCYPEHLRAEQDAEAHDLIQGLLALDPDARLGADTGVTSLHSHAFFRKSGAGAASGDLEIADAAPHSTPNPVDIDWDALESLPCEAQVQVAHVGDAPLNARAVLDLDAAGTPHSLPPDAFAAVITEPTAVETETRAVATALLESLEQPGLPEGLSGRIAALDEYRLAVARMLLRQHGRLHEKKVWKALHRNAPLLDTRARRASLDTREYVGLEKQQQGSWDKPFYYVTASGPAPDDEILALIKHLNSMRPPPAFLAFIVSGEGVEETRPLRKLFLKLSVTIPVLFVPGVGAYDAQAFGADWYGFWCQGFRGLVINSNLLMQPEMNPEAAVRMEDWLDEQLEQSKLASQRACVFSAHPWFLQEPAEENPDTEGRITIPLAKRARWLNRFLKEDIDTGVTSGAALGAADTGGIAQVPGKIVVPAARSGDPVGAPRRGLEYIVKLGAYVRPGHAAAETDASGGGTTADEPAAPEEARNAGPGGKLERKIVAAEDVPQESDDETSDDDSEDAEPTPRPHCVVVPPLSSPQVPGVLVVTVARYETARAIYSLESLPEQIRLPVQVEEER